MLLMRRVALAIAIVAVLTAYVFFATAGTMRFERAPDPPRGWDNPGGGYYAQLAEGFRRGNTYFPIAPDPQLSALPDPYDYGARDRAHISYLWDASYYRGRYYLYFTPLPVVFFYLPYRFLTGGHAGDGLASVFFCAWTFIAAVLFLWRTRSRVLWIVFAGLANLIPFALSSTRVYEVAIFCATALSATWALALQRFEEKPSVSAAFWTSLWLSLAIFARPNLLVLVLPTAIVFWRHRSMRAFIAAAVPVLITSAAYLGYNYARFGEPLESGISYQLTFIPMRGLSRCSLCNAPELFRFVSNALQYAFTPPHVFANFPHAEAAQAVIDRRTSWPGDPEEIIGIVPLVPLILVGTMLMFTRRPRAGALVLGGAWLVLFALSTCWWIVSRYAFDFQILMLLGTAACIDDALPNRPLRIAAMILALYSITFGLLLGLEGRAGAFRTQNPALLQRIGGALHVDVR